MSRLIRRPMPPPPHTMFNKFNNTNEYEYAPYVVSDQGVLTIDKTWWNSLSEFIQKKIQSKTSFELNDITIPHDVNPRDIDNGLLGLVYRCYLEGFDYQNWYSSTIPNGPKDVILIPLNENMKQELLGEQTDTSQLSILEDQLNDVCSKGIEYFVRLSGTSGKNEKPVRPFKYTRDILQHLKSIELFRSREYKRDKETVLVLIPWNDNIDHRCEFRIFIVNKKITAASPQHFWELNQFSAEELESFELALNNIEFINYVPYDSFVADVYIDTTTNKCHLIELNPFGAHCGAGASFFNWIDDYNILHGIEPPEMRYLSVINF